MEGGKEIVKFYQCTCTQSSLDIFGAIKNRCIFCCHNFKDDINTYNEFGNTPLNHAVTERAYEIAKILLMDGADPNKPSKREKWTPLHIASYFAFNQIMIGEKGVVEVEEILENSSDIEDSSFDDEYKYYNESQDFVKLLLNYNADRALQNLAGSTPLHFAASKGYRNIVKILMNSPLSLPLNVTPDILETWSASSSQFRNITSLFLLILKRNSYLFKLPKPITYVILREIYKEIFVRVFFENFVGIKDYEGKNACQRAQEEGFTGIVKILDQHIKKEHYSVKKETNLKKDTCWY